MNVLMILYYCKYRKCVCCYVFDCLVYLFYLNYLVESFVCFKASQAI